MARDRAARFPTTNLKLLRFEIESSGAVDTWTLIQRPLWICWWLASNEKNGSTNRAATSHDIDKSFISWKQQSNRHWCTTRANVGPLTRVKPSKTIHRTFLPLIALPKAKNTSFEEHIIPFLLIPIHLLTTWPWTRQKWIYDFTEKNVLFQPSSLRINESDDGFVSDIGRQPWSQKRFRHMRNGCLPGVIPYWTQIMMLVITLRWMCTILSPLLRRILAFPMTNRSN
jgi:hypothetical protein